MTDNSQQVVMLDSTRAIVVYEHTWVDILMTGIWGVCEYICCLAIKCAHTHDSSDTIEIEYSGAIFTVESARRELPADSRGDLFSFKTILFAPLSVNTDVLTRARVAIDDTLAYPIGTTGNPKVIMTVPRDVVFVDKAGLNHIITYINQQDDAHCLPMQITITTTHSFVARADHLELNIADLTYSIGNSHGVYIRMVYLLEIVQMYNFYIRLNYYTHQRETIPPISTNLILPPDYLNILAKKLNTDTNSREIMARETRAFHASHRANEPVTIRAPIETTRLLE